MLKDHCAETDLFMLDVVQTRFEKGHFTNKAFILQTSIDLFCLFALI